MRCRCRYFGEAVEWPISGFCFRRMILHSRNKNRLESRCAPHSAFHSIRLCYNIVCEAVGGPVWLFSDLGKVKPRGVFHGGCMSMCKLENFSKYGKGKRDYKKNYHTVSPMLLPKRNIRALFPVFWNMRKFSRRLRTQNTCIPWRSGRHKRTSLDKYQSCIFSSSSFPPKISAQCELRQGG